MAHATRTCTVDGCDRKHYGRGLCSMHYHKHRIATIGKTCTAPGCDRPESAKGFCALHYVRSKRGEPKRDTKSKAGELWRDVPGLEGKYQASDHGRVRSVDRTATTSDGLVRRHLGRVLRSPLGATGYPEVNIEGKSTKAHHLVAAAFMGERPEHLVVNHKNGVKTDNRPANLEYVTIAENNQHAWDVGLQTPRSPATRPRPPRTARGDAAPDCHHALGEPRTTNH